LDIENSVRSIPLSEDPLLSRNRQALPALANGGEEAVRIECAMFLACRCGAHH
jgi:hypothetical protein